jgi:lipopolysaccharide export system protein LptA
MKRLASTRIATALLGFAAALALPAAWPLTSDNDQPMDITANHQKSVQSKTGAANDPDITDLDGNVIITRGSIKIHADHARIYQIPAGAKDPNAGKFSHIVLTGKQAHMQQLHDEDCSPMSADANTIDYKPLTNLAELTGNVKVVQGGRGESHSEHMIYNTATGEMEAGDNSAGSRVHMVLEPSSAKPAPRSDNCGYPAAKPRQK